MKTIFYLTILSLFGLFVLQCSTGSAGNNKNTVQNMTANKNIAPAQPGDDAPRIALADAKKNFDDGTALFVDTHGKAAYDAEHIKGSINISGENFEAEYSKLPKDKKIIAYCSWANEHTSASLVTRLKQKGYTNAYALLGGTQAWKTANYPMQAGAVK